MHFLSISPSLLSLWSVLPPFTDVWSSSCVLWASDRAQWSARNEKSSKRQWKGRRGKRESTISFSQTYTHMFLIHSFSTLPPLHSPPLHSFHPPPQCTADRMCCTWTSVSASYPTGRSSPPSNPSFLPSTASPSPPTYTSPLRGKTCTKFESLLLSR